MKSMLLFVLVLAMSAMLFAADLPGVQIPTVQLQLLTNQSIYQNGDKVEISGKGFPEGCKINLALIVVINSDGSFSPKTISQSDLKINDLGILSGSVVINELDKDDRYAFISVSATTANVSPTEKFSVEGDLEPFGPNILFIEAAFTFDDSNGNNNNIAELNERLDVTTTSTVPPFSGSVVSCLRWEYDNLGVNTAFVNLSTSNLSISGGSLSGYTINDTTAYNANTIEMSLFVQYGTPPFSTTWLESSNRLSTIDTDPPDLTNAYATALDTIQLIFNEPVSEVGGGDAASKFDFGGTVGPSISGSSIIPVGGSTTDTWNLVISGLTNRGVGDLTIAYDSTNTGTTDLQDDAGNVVKGNPGPSITVQDSIPPAATAMRDSANSAALTIGEFIGNSSYLLRARVTGGNNDASLDSLVFEGSDNGTDWTVIGIDDSPTANGSDADFEWAWNVSIADSQFKVLRVRAFDTNDNVTNSGAVGSAIDGFNDNFEDTYRAVIEKVLPSSIGQSSGTIRAAVVVELQNNYGDSVNTIGTSKTFNVSESSTTTESWWSASSGGSGVSDSMSVTIVTTAGEDTVWYSNTAAGGPNTLVLNEVGNDFALNNGDVTANNQTVTVTISKIVNVSNEDPPVDSNIDSTATGGDLTLQADVDGPENTGDDFRILWGFTNTANPTPAQISEIDTSADLTPPSGGGTVTHSVPVDSLQNLSTTYFYMFYWLENVTTTADSTILDGFPIKADPARLILNPELVTAAGDNGSDARGGDFTPGVNNQEIVSIKFTTDPTEATIKISGLVFDYTLTSTADENDLSTFHLYRDAGTIGTYDQTLDVLLDDVPVTAGMSSVNFNEISPILNVTGTGVHVLVAVDVRSGANGNHTLGMKLSGPTSINLDPASQVVQGPNSSINIRSFSDIGTSRDYSLPVTLVSFEARSGYGKIMLEWSTASEENNAGFYIMRSDNSEGEFVRLNADLIEGHGNANTTHNYSFVDADIEPDVTYYYKLFSVDYNGDVYTYAVLATGSAMALPKTFAIYQNYPNPFNPSTRLKFDIPQRAEISIEIYNMLGQKVRTLVKGEVYQPGVYENVIWDARDDRGNQISNGIYYMVFSAKDFDYRQVRKLVFMK